MRRGVFAKLAALTVIVVVVGAACTTDEGDEDQEAGQQPEEGVQSTLQMVQDRGTLNCGVNDVVPGFGLQTEDGDFEGFDVDFCKAVAAAVLGDPEAVEYTPLTVETRLPALQAGEVDVLIRNTTWTASRDGGEGLTFATTTFYDGQGMMVREETGFTELEELDGATICVLSATTTELNLASVFSSRGIDFEQLSFEDNETLQQAFEQERCEAWTSDKSQLAGVRSAWPDAQGGPEALFIMEALMSKEPLGPVTRDGDSQWSQIIDWVVIATIQAEEYGITSENIDEMMDSDDPGIARFLGQPGEEGVFDPGLGLEPDFAVDVINAVGNYGEIYDRHVGPDTPLGLERLLNDLWTEGGLLFPPPYV